MTQATMTSPATSTVPAGLPWTRRFAWLGVLVAGTASYLLVLRTLVKTDNPNFFPSLILLGSIVVPLAVLVFAAGSNRRTVTSPAVVVFTAITGGIIGTVTAGTLEYEALHDLDTLPMILVGLIEELAKLVVPLALLMLLRRPDRQSGVVIGVASGMGFATLETMGYGFTALMSAGHLEALDQTLLLRALLSPAGHVAWTGLAVAAMWQIPTARRQGRALVVALTVFLTVVLLHAAWDGFDSVVMHLVVGGLSVVALLVTIRGVHRGGAAELREPAPDAGRGQG